MNDLLMRWGIETWKPVAGALLLPPVPLLALALLAILWRRRRPFLSGLAMALSLLGLWAGSTTLVGNALTRWLTHPPPVLTAAQVASLAQAPKTAIVVLGGGLRRLAPEYGGADLKVYGMERLRYGLWLARQTRLPVAFSGGVSLGRTDGPTEADVARQVAQRDFNMPIRWLETASRDTNENALYSVRLLRAEGIQRIVLVTHGFHQQRAMAAFQRAMERANVQIALLPAPLGPRIDGPLRVSSFLPSIEGFSATRLALHEWLGWLAGA